jgi:CheY-like chemotaxis protein
MSISVKTSIDKCYHVLFVDDDSEESYLFNEALEHSGLKIQLSKAKDGNELLNYLATHEMPDLVLIDINMPYMNGVEALYEIRNIPAYNNLPLVIYSTSSSQQEVDKCFQYGANLFVVKPDNFDSMVEVVNHICSMNWQDQIRTRDQFVLSF